MKKILIVLAVILLLAGCAPTTENRADIAAEFVHAVWDVDYATYSENVMIKFAKEHYEKEYYDDLMLDAYENTGVADIKKERLVSRVLGTENIESSSFEDVDGNVYFTESVKASVSIDSFEPAEDTVSAFEAGGVYTVIYDVYFTEERGKPEIVGFDVTLETGTGDEQRTLTEAERSAAGDVIREYVYAGWSVDENYSAEDVLAFYKANLSEEFIERDGLTSELLKAREEEVQAFGVTIDVAELSVSVQPNEAYATVGTDKVMCFKAEAKYTVEISGNAEYLAAVGLQEHMEITEIVYFKADGGVITLVGAEYK